MGSVGKNEDSDPAEGLNTIKYYIILSTKVNLTVVNTFFVLNTFYVLTRFTFVGYRSAIRGHPLSKMLIRVRLKHCFQHIFGNPSFIFGFKTVNSKHIKNDCKILSCHYIHFDWCVMPIIVV